MKGLADMDVRNSRIALGVALLVLVTGAGCKTFTGPLSEAEARVMQVGELARVHLEVHGMT